MTCSVYLPLTQDDDVDVGRECIIKALCVYLNEDPANLVREYVVSMIIRVQYFQILS